MVAKGVELGTDDLELARSLLRMYPGFGEMVTLARRITDEVGYPVHSFEDLLEGLGGDQAKVEMGGRTILLAGVRRWVPPYLFPISNQRDLMAKLEHVWRSVRNAHGRPMRRAV
jgi:hypothetical protein